MCKEYNWMNRETGELLTDEEAKRMWLEEYDGEDPTNAVCFCDVFQYGPW